MEFTTITSRTNPTVVSLAKLADKKERDKTGLYLAEGYKLCCEAAERCRVRYVLLREDKQSDPAFLALAEASGGGGILLSDGAFDKISQDKASDGIVFVIEMDIAPLPDSFANNRLCILDCVRDPGNVGTILRTAAAFGADCVILCGCADIYHPKVIRSSMGAVFHIGVYTVSDLPALIACLQGEKRRVLAAALSDDGMILGREPLSERDCLIIGNEGHGVSEAVLASCDGTVQIPMSGKTESLNAAAAAAVLLWEWGRAPQ